MRRVLPGDPHLSRLLRRTLAVTGLLLAPASAPAQAHLPADSAIARLLATRIAEGRGVGIVVGVLEADGTTRFAHAGSAGDGARPLGPETVFEIGSITKVFTATLLADMARRGEVSLDDPISRHLPANTPVPARGGRQITLVDLATHRSALPRIPTNMTPADPANPYADYSVEQLYAFLAGYSLPRDIGAQMEYSNLGVGLLGHLLARAAEQPYETLVRDRLLDPLGMTQTGITLDAEMQGWMARGHDAAGNPVPLWDLPTLAGAGALRSDARDMLRFAAANLGPPETDLERAMRETHLLRTTESAGAGGPAIGLAWVLQPAAGGPILWHNGGTGGFRSFLGMDPARQVAVVVLANGNHSVDDIGLHLLDATIPLTAAPRQRTEVAVAPERLADYVGEYEVNAAFALVVTLEGSALFALPTGQSKAQLFAEADDAFFLRIVDAQIVFGRDAEGRVTGLTIHQNGQAIPARKVR